MTTLGIPDLSQSYAVVRALSYAVHVTYERLLGCTCFPQIHFVHHFSITEFDVCT